MTLNDSDIAIIALYLFLVFIIAWSADTYVQKHRKRGLNAGLSPIESHYLAGRTITFPEALLSMIATEFSAIAFLAIPAYVYFGNLTAIAFLIGTCCSRFLIAQFLLPKLYGRGTTIFEILARGDNPASSPMSGTARQGQKIFSMLYIVTSSVGVGVRLLGGSVLISQFLGTPLFFTIFVIAMFTYVYVAIGGLKAVVRTDMVQAGIFIFGGIMAHVVIANVSDASWREMFHYGAIHGKLVILHHNEIWTFVLGIIAGIAHDAATHGLDQEFAQKLLGAKNLSTARSAVMWSALGTVAVYALFLSLGVILWSFYNMQGMPVPASDLLFSNVIINYFPSPLRGLMVASILAACMSTLDSAINALSSCWWNDFMPVKKTKSIRLYITLDNLIITLAIVLIAYMFSFSTSFANIGLFFGSLCLAPMLALFVHRMFLWSKDSSNYTPFTIVSIVALGACAMAICAYYFHLSPQHTTLTGLLTAFALVHLYPKFNTLDR